MQTDVLIVGCGISGTFLTYFLQQSDTSFIVIDESTLFTASKAAAGIINPVTGRRIVKTWMIDELIHFAKVIYRKMDRELDIHCIRETKITDFFPTPQMRNAFLERFGEDAAYLRLPSDENDHRNHFDYDFGYGEIEPVLLININELLGAMRKKLLASQVLLEEHFDISELVVSEKKICYKDIIAEKIIFCDGVESISNPYFKNLPFAPNKGEALIVEIKELPAMQIFKKGINLVPWKDNLFWVGSSYEWKFDNDKPTEGFRHQTEAMLRGWIKTDFTIADHIASVRPATLERRPFAGFHPVYKNVGILNGMGTKGCSLAPYFANQLVNHICKNEKLDEEANIKRFDKILSRN
jgi:glycine/D-amino acid oxidase-like deaminating enzyme